MKRLSLDQAHDATRTSNVGSEPVLEPVLEHVAVHAEPEPTQKPRRVSNKQQNAASQVDGVVPDAEPAAFGLNLDQILMGAGKEDIVAKRVKVLSEARVLKQKKHIELLIAQATQMWLPRVHIRNSTPKKAKVKQLIIDLQD